MYKLYFNVPCGFYHIFDIEVDEYLFNSSYLNDLLTQCAAVIKCYACCMLYVMAFYSVMPSSKVVNMSSPVLKLALSILAWLEGL